MSTCCQGILPFLCATVLSIWLLFAEDTLWRFLELPVTVPSRRQENAKGKPQICSEVPPNSFSFHLPGILVARAQSKGMLLNVHLHKDGPFASKGQKKDRWFHASCWFWLILKGIGTFFLLKRQSSCLWLHVHKLFSFFLEVNFYLDKESGTTNWDNNNGGDNWR